MWAQRGRITWWRSVVLAAAGLGVAPWISSCFSGPDSPSGEDAYAGRLSGARCDSMAPCCSENGLAFDHDNCVLGGAGFVQAGVDQARKFGAKFNAQAADACVAGTERLARSCQATSDERATYEACRRVWSGTKAPGETCSTDVECASSAVGRGACHRPSPGTGVCVVLRTPASVGDVCLVLSGSPPAELADCEPDLQCNLVTGTCEVLVDVGGNCPGFTRCVSGAYCDGGGACRDKLAPESPCAADGECSGGACIHGVCAHNPLGTPTPCNGSK